MLSIELSLFVNRLAAICEEMGAALKRAAFSPNIKDRLDYSCALFDPAGRLCAQAAHIPVHLGSMAFAMHDVVKAIEWQQGDVLVVNDPYLGGTHLPDVTVVAPVFHNGHLRGFAANRAHHANIGSSSPGSMPIARRLDEEGAVVPPTLLVRAGKWHKDVLMQLSGGREDARSLGDFYAQVSSVELGVKRLGEWLAQSTGDFSARLEAVNDYGEALALQVWSKIPDGEYHFEDFMDDDGIGAEPIAIRVRLRVHKGAIEADFHGTSRQADGNINCPLSVTAAAVYYVLRCLLPAYAPACAGTFAPISLRAEPGSLVNALRPAAVAAGNVETSSRIVDVVLGALAQALPEVVPAASQGTMNNIAMGAEASGTLAAWDYYETLGGGAGGGPGGAGASGRQTHMTNTLNTPVESIEQHFPVRVERYALRRGSGGAGESNGGDGVERMYLFLADTEVTLLTERRRFAPWGSNGAASGQCGENRLNGELLPGKTQLHLRAGDRLNIATPGGGGWNCPPQKR